MLRLSWLISLGISLFGVMIIEYFFTVKHDEVAKAGNLGAMGLALMLPFIVLSLYTTFRFFAVWARTTPEKNMRWIYLTFGFGLVAVLCYYANGYTANVYAELGGNTTTPGSIIYGFPALNEYTNRVFINFYTFAIIHTVIALIGAIVGILKPAKHQDKNAHFDQD